MKVKERKMMPEEEAKRTRNLGEIRVQESGGELCGGTGWIDVATSVTGSGGKPFESIGDAGAWIEGNGRADATYRIVRVYPPVKVVETKHRTLEPA